MLYVFPQAPPLEVRSVLPALVDARLELESVLAFHCVVVLVKTITASH